MVVLRFRPPLTPALPATSASESPVSQSAPTTSGVSHGMPPNPPSSAVSKNPAGATGEDVSMRVSIRLLFVLTILIAAPARAGA